MSPDPYVAYLQDLEQWRAERKISQAEYDVKRAQTLANATRKPGLGIWTVIWSTILVVIVVMIVLSVLSHGSSGLSDLFGMLLVGVIGLFIALVARALFGVNQKQARKLKRQLAKTPPPVVWRESLDR